MKKTFNKQLLLFSLKLLLLKIVVLCKRKWIKLVKVVINEDNFDSKKYKWKSRCAIFIIGLCNFVASTPISFIIILPLTFGSLFFILDKVKYREIKTQVSIIFFFLLGHFVSIFWWLFVPLTTNLKSFFWLMPFAIFGIPFLISLIFLPFFTFGLLIWNKFIKGKRYDYLYLVSIFCFCWFCGDYVRGHFIFGGFPWMMFGHFITNAYMMQIVKFIGVDIYSIFFLLLVLVPYLWIFKKSVFLRKFCLIICSLWVVNICYGLYCINFGKTQKLSVNIIGSQINQPATYYSTDNVEKEYLSKRLNLISWIASSKQPTIILLPEGAVNEPLISGSDLSIMISKFIPNEKSIMLLGGIDYDGVLQYNSIFSLTHSGDVIATYKKNKLVPFGEYIPLRKYFPFFVRNITGGMIDFSTSEYNNLFTFYRDLPYIYPIICYESIFPHMVKENIKKSREFILKLDGEYMKRNKIKKIDERGEIIVNLTNDAWMKWSFGGYQHFLMTRYLAIISELPVIRVSNNGISAYINKYGKVIEKTNFNQEDILFIKK